MRLTVCTCLCLIYTFLFLTQTNIAESQATEQTFKQFSISECLTIGCSDEEGTEKDPAFFYSLSSLDCDNEGNIYVLDRKDCCIKKFDRCGKFIKRFFQKGDGPSDLSNPFGMAINRFNNHIFILQNYGFHFKECDTEGAHIKYHQLPQQFFGIFTFYSADEYFYKNITAREGEFNALIMASLTQKKNLKEYVPVQMRMELNINQYFSIHQNLIWTSPANDMLILAFDIKTGEKVQEIAIPGEFKTNTLIQKKTANDVYLTYPIIYNLAQPFFIEDQLFILLILQDFAKKDGELDRLPVKWERSIYQVNDGKFSELLTLKNSDDLYIGTVYQSRVFLYSNEPYSRIRVLEFKK